MSIVEQERESLDVYHADTSRVTRSQLKVFQRSRRVYEAMYVKRTVATEPASLPLIIGSVAHTMLLEPHRVDEELCVIPDAVLTSDGKRSGKAWREFESNNATKSLLKQAEFDVVRGMVDAVLADPQARQLVELPGRVEHTVTWTDSATGIDCKCRPDKLADVRIIADLKTADDPTRDAFAKAAANYGYAEQCAWYLDGCQASLGGEFDFWFVVVGKEPPHIVRVYELDEEDVTWARARNRAALRELKRCRETGDYADDGEGQIIPLSLPKWAKSNGWRN